MKLKPRNQCFFFLHMLNIQIILTIFTLFLEWQGLPNSPFYKKAWKGWVSMWRWVKNMADEVQTQGGEETGKKPGQTGHAIAVSYCLTAYTQHTQLRSIFQVKLANCLHPYLPQQWFAYQCSQHITPACVPPLTHWLLCSCENMKLALYTRTSDG